MVNSRLKSPRSLRSRREADSPGQDRSAPIFATNAPLTNEIIAIGTARSRFGPADSWVIKIAGGSFCRGELTFRAGSRIRSPLGVPFLIRFRRSRLKKRRLPGTKHAGSHIFLRIRGGSGAD